MLNELPRNNRHRSFVFPQIVLKALHKCKVPLPISSTISDDVLGCELLPEAILLVSDETYLEIMDLASRIFKTTSISSAIARDFQINYSCLLSNIAINSATAGDVIESFCRYSFLIGNVKLSTEIIENSCKVSILSTATTSDSYCEQIETEAILVFLIALIGKACNVKFLPSKAVLTSYIRNSQTQDNDKFFGDTIETSRSDVNELWFPKSALSCKTLKPNANCLKLLTRKAEQISHRMISTQSMSDQILKLLRCRSGTSVPNLKELSDQLKMSPRSLQRRLKEENATFYELVDKVRFEKAVLKLNKSSRDIASISTELGFKNLPSFYCAFKRWSGTTPKSYVNSNVRA